MNPTPPARSPEPSETPSPGDRVVHRSGGQAMTVASALGGRVFCTWFDKDGNQQFRGFPPDVLLKTETADA
jgi:uncharacterized protein YodC (DUF2158 family)